MGDESGGTLPTIDRTSVKGRKKDTPEVSLKRKIVSLEKQVEELKKKLREPVILSKRNDAQANSDEATEHLSAGEAMILGRRKGTF